jgi:transposase
VQVGARAWCWIYPALRERAPLADGLGPVPTAAVIDSQTVRAADTVPTASSGDDGGKKIKGRKRHLAVDTGGLLLAVVVTTASLQDRDGAFRITAALREAFSTITLVWAGRRRVPRPVRPRRAQDHGPGGGDRQAPDQAKGFVLLHRRWVVERSFAWLTKFRRSYATTRPSQPPTKP